MSERNNPTLRFFDEKLGPIIVYMLGLITSKKVTPANSIQNVILLKTAAIGDTILLSAIVAQIKKSQPEIKITLAVGTSNLEIAQMIPGVSNIMHLPIKNPLKSILTLRSKKFDAIIDFDSWPRINAILCFFSKAQYRIGFKTKNQNRHWVFHKTVDHSDQCHEVDNYANLARVIFKNLQAPFFPKLSFDHQKIQKISSNSKKIIFHLCAGGALSKEKSWPLERWTQLALQLMKPKDELILTGTSANQEVITLLSKNLKTKLPEVQVTEVIDFSLSSLTQVISEANLVVTVDTGIAHLAAALNAPTIVLYGPTSPARWGALGEKVCSIISKSEQAGTTSLGFDNQDKAKDTMRGISVEDVVKVARESL